MDDRESFNKTIKILFFTCLILFLIGMFMSEAATTRTVYSTGEYWVAKDYHHVYEKYSGQIVDVIEDDETCKIDGDKITVTKRKQGLYVAGGAIYVFFGICLFCVIITAIGSTEWWEKVWAITCGKDY